MYMLYISADLRVHHTHMMKKHKKVDTH